MSWIKKIKQGKRPKKYKYFKGLDGHVWKVGFRSKKIYSYNHLTGTWDELKEMNQKETFLEIL